MFVQWCPKHCFLFCVEGVVKPTLEDVYRSTNSSAKMKFVFEEKIFVRKEKSKILPQIYCGNGTKMAPQIYCGFKNRLAPLFIKQFMHTTTCTEELTFWIVCKYPRYQGRLGHAIIMVMAWYDTLKVSKGFLWKILNHLEQFQKGLLDCFIVQKEV